MAKNSVFDTEQETVPPFDAILGGAIIALILGTGVYTVAHPTRIVSEKENRELAIFPETSINTIFDGSFSKDFETYASDQFAWRDAAVSLKADAVYLMGRPENNGILFSDDGYLISRPDDFCKDNIDANIASLMTFKEKGKYNLTVAAIPTAYEILQDKLPSATYRDTVPLIENEIKEQLQDTDVQVCDTTEILNEHKDEYIYYRTDHHQTALGSYYVYAKLGEYLGYEPEPLESFSVTSLSDDFLGTTWSKASLTLQKRDTIDQYTLNGFPMSYTVEYPLEESKMMGLYAKSVLRTKDKYSVYIGGNHGLTVIRNAAGTSGRSIALLKDSYAHSLAPFLATVYDNIYLVDMRYYNDDIIMYLGQNKVEDVLALYAADSINTSNSLGSLTEIAETTSYVPRPKYGLVPELPPVTPDYFDDAVFFGDSLTVGHSTLSELPGRFVAKSATNTVTINTETMPSGNTMIDELLAQEGVGKYYINFGMNEISFTSVENYLARYRKLIGKIKAVNPDALIYIEGLMPIERKAETFDLTNEIIRKYNAALCGLAEECECYFLDLFWAISEPDGYLRDGAAEDGMHFDKKDHLAWDAYLVTHAVNLNPTSEAEAFTLYTGGGTADIEGFVNDILGSVEFKDNMSAVTDNVAARMYHLEAGSVVAGTAYASGGSTAEEFAIFEAATPEQAQDIGEKLKQRAEEKKPNFETYKPAEMAKLNNPVIVVNGNVAMLCISDNNDAAKAVMSKY